jgi:excisionase family DNA binding protein
MTTTPKRRMAVEPFATPKELCERWRTSAATITRLVKSGQLLAMRIGRSIRVKLSEVERYEKFGPRRTA